MRGERDRDLPAGASDRPGAWFTAAGCIPRVFAGHLDIAAQRQQADLVIRIAMLDAKEARPEAHGE